MYCNQCGKQLPDDAKFCHHCGSAIGIEQKEKTDEVPQEEIVIPKQKKEKVKKEKGKKEKPEKPKKANGKKSLIILIAIAVAIIAIIAGIVIAISNHQKVLAELPDPEYFFSEVGIDEINESKDVKQVILRSDENLWNEAAGYVDLLKWSGKYPVSQSDEARYSSGDYMWNFVYNNREDIKSPYFAQVEINYYCKSNGRDNYAVWITIHDTDAFDLVEREQYEEPAAADTTPSVDFSGVSGDSTESPSVNDSTSDWESDVEDDDDDSYEVPDAADIYDNPTPCGVCNRSGDCQTCSGDGYLMSSASDEEDRNCYSCSGSGNCRSCGGDGEL